MYAELLRQRLNEVGLISELVMLRGDANNAVVQGAVQDASRRRVLFACVINEQNAVHKSLTVNILHGQQQGKIQFVVGEAYHTTRMLLLTRPTFPPYVWH
jgi:hypothetical protein